MQPIKTATPLTEGLKKAADKLLYIERIKILLTVLVVLHHACVTYGAPGGWYYNEKTTHMGALIPMTLFVSLNQSFFMGFFFFIAAYFTPSSYDKKGPIRFTLDRLKRLGIPLVFYSFMLSPFLSFMVYYFAKGNHITYWQYLGGFDHWVDFGVLWFVLALLFFSLIYVGFRLIVPKPSTAITAPGAGKIVVFALALGIVSFLVRIIFPVGFVLQPFGFQLGHFSQYIGLFIAGLIASRGQWLSNPDYKTAKKFAWMVLVMLLFFPVLFIIRKVTNSSLDAFNGYGYWQSLVYGIWEQLTGIFIIVALLGIYKRKKNTQSNWSADLSRSTFAVYIFHPLILIFISVMLKPWGVDPSVKVLVVAPAAVIGTFVLAYLILKIKAVSAVI